VAAEVVSSAFTLDGVEPSPSQSVNGSTVDLNEVNFEGLIALGISVGQAARFISQRERRGGISALSEIDGFYGLTPGVREILRWSGNV
jgi:hypothetical protein